MIIEELTTVLGLEIRDEGIQRFQSGLLAIAGRMALVTAGAIAAAAAIGSVISAAAGAAKEISDQAKLARNIGVTTQALHGLEFAAQQVGLPAGTLSGVLHGLSQEIDKIPSGLTDLESRLNVLGISARDSEGNLKGVRDILFEVADAVHNAPDSLKAFRRGQASEIFPGMRAFLELGSAGIKDLEAQSRPPSDRLVESAEKLIASWGRVREVFLSFSLENLALPMIDAMNGVADAVERIAKSEYFDKFSEQMGKVSRTFGAFYKRTIDEALPQLAKVQELSEGIVKNMFGVKELSGSQTALAMVLAGVLSMTPQGPAAAADVQDYLSGKAGTQTEAEMNFFSQMAEQLVNFGPRALSSLGGRMIDPLGTGGPVNSGAPSQVIINHEHHWAPGTDVPRTMRELDREGASEVRKALDDQKPRMRR